MIKVAKNNILTIQRGDYAEVPIFINAGDELNKLRYSLQGEDVLCLSIMEPNQPFEYGIIRKIYDITDLNSFGDVIMKLDMSDTENVLPGLYYYSLKLIMARGNKQYVCTVVPNRKVYIVD